MTYPIIMNGDHAEFEQEYANVPAKERPDWPLPSFDARDWAAAFNDSLVKRGEQPLDPGLMLGWFANALMRGFDEHASRVPAFFRTRWGFRSKTQSPLFMVWREHWHGGEVVHADVLFSTRDWIGA